MPSEDNGLENTAYHELGHALTSALLGYDSYVDVIRFLVSDEWKRGMTITPGINQYSPIEEYVLRVFGGSLGEFLHSKTLPINKDELLAWLRHDERRTSGTRSDWRSVSDVVGNDLDSWLVRAADFAVDRLYQPPTVSLFPDFAAKLVSWGSAKVLSSGGAAELAQDAPLSDEERATYLSDRYPARFGAYVSDAVKARMIDARLLDGPS